MGDFKQQKNIFINTFIEQISKIHKLSRIKSTKNLHYDMTVILLQLNKRTMKIYCLPCHVYNISSQHITEVKWQWEENCFEHLVFNYHSLLKLPSNCLSTNKCAASVQVIWTSNISFVVCIIQSEKQLAIGFGTKSVCFFVKDLFRLNHPITL